MKLGRFLLIGGFKKGRKEAGCIRGFLGLLWGGSRLDSKKGKKDGNSRIGMADRHGRHLREEGVLIH